MTKKDYDVIAACLGISLANGNDGAKDVQEILILKLSYDNPRFDSQKFAQRVQYWYEQTKLTVK